MLGQQAHQNTAHKDTLDNTRSANGRTIRPLSLFFFFSNPKCHYRDTARKGCPLSLACYDDDDSPSRPFAFWFDDERGGCPPPFRLLADDDGIVLVSMRGCFSHSHPTSRIQKGHRPNDGRGMSHRARSPIRMVFYSFYV
jgi:hypothetical protein